MRPKIPAVIWLGAFLTMLGGQATPAAGASAAPAVSAQAAALIEVETGLLLWQRKATERRYPASLTKVMTALLALEYAGLNEKITIGELAASVGESSLDLVAGETLTVNQLVHGVLLKSANDASFAVAEHVAGSKQDFAAMMNTKAAELGLTGTHFVNPHGLHNPHHYSTALDLAHLARAAMLREDFRQIVCLPKTTIPGPHGEGTREALNRNRLIGHYEGANGVKTGYTRQAGRCLICSAARGRMHLLAVILDCEDTYADARSILDWGFASFEKAVLVAQGQTEAAIRVRDGKRPKVRALATQTVCTVLPKGRQAVAPRVIDSAPLAPVAVGDVVGALVVALPDGGETRVPLAAAEAVEKSLMATVRDKWPAAAALFCCLGVLAGARAWAHGASATTARRRRRRLAPGVGAPHS